MCYSLFLMQRRVLFVKQAENFAVYLLCFKFTQTSWDQVVFVEISSAIRMKASKS